jgi:antitoxin YefM
LSNFLGTETMMLNGLKQTAIVGPDGKIEISAAELPEGTQVEIIVLIIPPELDATDYLLSTEANRQQLLEAIDHVEKRYNLVTLTPEEWHEKHCL